MRYSNSITFAGLALLLSCHANAAGIDELVEAAMAPLAAALSSFVF